MRIRSLEIRNFRSLRNFKIEKLDSDIIVLTGENGAGKSSVFDAISIFIAKATPIRLNLPDPQEVLRKGESEGSIRIAIEYDPSEQEITNCREAQGILVFSDGSPNFTWDSGKPQGINQLLAERANWEELFLANPETDDREEDDIPGVFIHRSPYRFESPGPIENPNQNILETSQERSRRASLSNSADSRSDIIQNLLLSEHLQALSERQKKEREGEFESWEESKKYVEERQGAYLTDFDELLAPKTFSHIEAGGAGENAKFFVNEPEVGEIEMRYLSSGEKEVLFLFADFRRLSLENAVVAIDEPELHLHHRIQRRLISRLQTIGENNQFWLTTHSVPIVRASLNLGLGEVIHIRSSQNGENQAQPVTSRSDLSAMYTEIASDMADLLMNDNIVFVEGGSKTAEEARSDAEIYDILFPAPHFVFAPGGSKQAIELLSDLSSGVLTEQLPVEIRCLRDRDDLTQEQIIDKETQRAELKILRRRNIESYLVDPSVIRETIDRIDLPLAAQNLLQQEGVDGLLSDLLEDSEEAGELPFEDFKPGLEELAERIGQDPHEFKMEIAVTMRKGDSIPEELTETIGELIEADPSENRIGKSGAGRSKDASDGGYDVNPAAGEAFRQIFSP